MMPRGSADAVKCAVKMLGRIPTTLQINRIVFFPFRSLHCGELTLGEFHYNSNLHSGLKSVARILALTFTFIYASFHRNSRSLLDMHLENLLAKGRVY